MLSRRTFLGSGLALASTSALAQTSGTKRMIVDSQVHLWKAASADWPWVPGMKPQLPEPFSIEKLLAMMNEAGVDRVVVVPPSWPGDRNDYGLEAARLHPTRFAVMGRIPLKDPKSAALLPTWKQQPGMLGVRITFLGPNAPWFKDGTADWFWPAAEKAGLPVMFLVAGMRPEFVKIAERHPGLPIIIDHMSLTGDVKAENRIPAALDQVVAMAKYPNVSCKLSGTPGISSEAYPFRDMADHIKRVFDAFGPRRSHWGTDLTNSFDKATYKQRITHFTEELKFLSEDDKDWVMGKSILAKLGWA